MAYNAQSSIFSVDKATSTQAGNIGGMALMGSSMLEQFSPTPQGFNQAYKPKPGLQIADAASNIALSSGNPYAMAAAGLYKGAKAITGDFGMKDKFKFEQQEAKTDYYGKRMRASQNNLMARFNTSGNIDAEMYAYGGPMAGAEMPEYIEFEGPSHEKGGIDYKGAELEGGEVVYNDYVFSKRLGFADRAKKIARRGHKNYGLDTTADPIARNTSMRQQIVNEAELTDLMHEQENVRRAKGFA